MPEAEGAIGRTVAAWETYFCAVAGLAAEMQKVGDQ